MFTFLLVMTIAIGCSIDRSMSSLSEPELSTLKRFKMFPLENQLNICDDNEPGQRLMLCLTFISKESKKPLPNLNVHLYHTSIDGEYNPSNVNDETTARLNGSVVTNKEGEAFVETILPGDYGSSADNRHIHTTVDAAKPQAYDIHFKQYTGRMGRNFINGSDPHFLADLKQTDDSTLVAFVTMEVKNVAIPQDSQSDPPDCEWCGANEAPDSITWKTTIAGERIPGERLVLSGTVYETDGTTPASGVIIYAYHTNSDGVYEKIGNETGNGVRHGHLRGWIITNDEGHYQFNTIKPAPYPNHSEPAHVHMTLMRHDFPEYWVNATWFKGDRLITDQMINRLNRTGGFSNVVELSKNEEGVWTGKRDLILNPPK
jgi:protocatechuate 3,4-dioxygenase beta subunit